MDEDITEINASTRNEKIKSFFINNKKKIIICFSILILLVVSYFAYDEIQKRNKIKIADQYNNSKINFFSGNKTNIENEMVNIINKKDKTYSPLALYFLLDNNIINSQEKINNLFDIIINEIKIDREIKNLIIYKKALYNSDFGTENDLLKILNPIINSDSIWKTHALYLLGEYFLSKNEKQKSKEFFQKILTLENSNSEIRLQVEKKIRRDLSE
jgi:predicted negative regulator of RcsB-dependent stress response